MPQQLTVAVTGGSIGGLTAGLVLRDIGCDVRVFERSTAELEARGAGILVLYDTVRYFAENDVLDVEAVTTSVGGVQYLNADGSTRYEEKRTWRLSSWNTIYRNLLDCFGRDRYHRGAEVTGFEQERGEVLVRFADGNTYRCDLLVCADGVASTARQLLLPQVTPHYAGYVAWRGTVPEWELTAATYKRLHDSFTYQLLEPGHLTMYPIPNVDGDLRPGHRRSNFMLYENVAPGADLKDLLTDTEGEHHAVSVPPGRVRPHFVKEFRDFVEAHLAPPLREVVLRVDDPYVQVIFDIDVPAMAFGRICLIGDAAFAVRPHVGAGTAKAAADAWALAKEIADTPDDVPGALERWEQTQLELGRQLLTRAQDMGNRAQFEGTWVPGNPSLRFGLYGSGRYR